MLHCYRIFVFISFLVSRTVHILNCTLKLHLIQSKMSGEKKKEGPLIYVYDSALHYQFFCSQCYHLKLVGWSFVPNLFFRISKNCFNDGFNYECIYRIYDPISLWVISLHSQRRIETIPSEEISSIIYDPLLFHSFIRLCRNEE